MTRPTRPNHLIVVGALSDASGTPRDAKRSIDDRYSVPHMPVIHLGFREADGGAFLSVVEVV